MQIHLCVDNHLMFLFSFRPGEYELDRFSLRFVSAWIRSGLIGECGGGFQLHPITFYGLPAITRALWSVSLQPVAVAITSSPNDALFNPTQAISNTHKQHAIPFAVAERLQQIAGGFDYEKCNSMHHKFLFLTQSVNYASEIAIAWFFFHLIEEFSTVANVPFG